MRNRYKELLTEMAFLIGDRYISDLRYEIFNSDVKKAVKTIMPEEYSLDQWAIAAQYIGGKNRCFNCSKEARNYILNL